MKMNALGLLTALLLASTLSTAQSDAESANSLNNQFQELKKKSNNYQNYEVVDRAVLDNFWNNIEDSLNAQSEQVAKLQKDLASTQKNVRELESQIAERDEKITEQSDLIDNMSFLGIQIGKGAYVTITWAIIFVLIIVVLIVYFRFKKANRVTVETKKEINSLQSDFEAHRQRSRENETKIKRDLQTEINRVEELKEKLGKS